MQNMMNVLNSFFQGIPNVIVALLLLVIAFLVAWIAKKIVIKFMNLVKIEKLFKKVKLEEENTKAKEFIAKLVYLIVFVLFLPGILGKLGLTGISEPIMSMMNIFLTFLPNIIACILILIIGLFIAKIVKELLIPVLNKLNLDNYLSRLGFEMKGEKSIAEVLSTIIYVLILIPVVISALNTLNISAISEPAINMLHTIFNFIPNLAIGIVILFVGRFIANLVFAFLENVLESIGVDTFTKKVFETTGTKDNEKFSLAKTIAYIVKYVILIFFLVQALNVLKLDLLTNIGSAIIAYMPYALSTIIILGLAILLGNYIEKIILKKFPSNKASALLAKVVIITIGIFISLYQLGIAMQMVNAAFIIILGALAVAFAISFGFGGREFASHMLQRLEDKIDKK